MAPVMVVGVAVAAGGVVVMYAALPVGIFGLFGMFLSDGTERAVAVAALMFSPVVFGLGLVLCTTGIVVTEVAISRF
jgi:hypothetical protein